MVDLKHDLDIVSEFPNHFIVGMDEVGRGALAGPVMMGMVAVNYAAFLAPDVPIRDSKELKEVQRESIVSFYENDGKSAILYKKLVDCSAATIDDCGIETALDQCFESLLRSLHEQYQLPYNRIVVLLDGNREREHNGVLRHITCLTRPKADDYYVCTALASIFAKVRRDSEMRALNEEHPEYFWDQNKGYAGNSHTDAIRQFGLTAFHRCTFIH